MLLSKKKKYVLRETKTGFKIEEVNKNTPSDWVTFSPQQIPDLLSKSEAMEQTLESVADTITIKVAQEVAQTKMPKQDRYKNDPSDEMDYIDRSYIMQGMDGFRHAMRWTIDKYFDRFGKKDDPVSEARKIADYSIRFYEQVKEHYSKKVDKTEIE